jgi:hypothetical protein
MVIERNCQSLAAPADGLSGLASSLTHTLAGLPSAREQDYNSRAYVLAGEEDQNDACGDEMNTLFEFLTTEPAICPTA